VHGTTQPADPATGARNAAVFAMYHPAFALYDGSNRQTLFTDIQELPAAVLAARGRRGEADAALVSQAPEAPATPVSAPAPAAVPTSSPAIHSAPPSDADQLTLF
jgi:hypothetical protein